MKPARVVVCDDELLIRLWLAERLNEAGLIAEEVADGDGLLAALARQPADLVLLDLRLPGATGLELLPRIKALDATLPVIMMTAYGEVETAVAAVRAGAHHFLEKPINLPELLLLIEQALEARELRSEIERFHDGNRWRFADISLVGRSPAMRKVAELITRLGAKGSTMNVLLRGESGTGKDVVARAIHAHGPRCAQPFVGVNCTSLPDQLVESELFGHEAGSYTDARETKRGLFEIAHGGTVFLDEIGDIPKPMQAKLLHFLETYEFRRVGGVRSIEVDVHVIAATNRNLEAAVAAGDFREDLFYRLNVVPIVIPPLRERPEDIAPLALHFVELLCNDLRQPVRETTKEALRALEAYCWPGNARELRNVIERVLLLEDSNAIQAEQLPAEVRGVAARDRKGMVLPANGLDLEELERDLICQAFARSEGNKTGAARLLGLSRDTLRYRLEKYGIN